MEKAMEKAVENGNAQAVVRDELQRLMTAENCSIGQPDVFAPWDAVVGSAWEKVELWWPWAAAEVGEREIEGLAQVLVRGGKQLVALNAFGGDLAAGDRGVLHREALPVEHAESLRALQAATGVSRYNVLLGRGGAELQGVQVERFVQFAARVAAWGGVAMVEPLSGLEDYPVTSVAQAGPLLNAARAAGVRAGVLLDVYHLYANGFVWDEICSQVEELGGWHVVEHVQFADFPGRGALGSGDVPVARIVQELRAFGYAGELVLECL